MRTLTRYVSRDVLFSTLLIFTALLMLFSFFDLINEMKDVGKGSYTLTAAVLFVALNIPSRLYELFPVAALIGTLFAIAQLVANSEWTVMRASGASVMQLGWAVVRVGIPLALATFLAGEFVAPPAERLAQTLRASARGDSTGMVAQQFDSGFWFKQDLTFVNIRTVLADMKLVGIRIYEFDPQLRLTTVRSAEQGSFSGDGKWKLEQVKVTELKGDSASVSSMPTWMWETVLKPSILTVYQVAPERLAIATLYDNIRVLGSSQKTSRFEIALWGKLFYPVTVLVMMLLALPFAQFQRRQSGMGFRLFAGTMLGLTFFLVGQLFKYLGVLNAWPPMFSALFPLATFSIIAFAMQWYIERRVRRADSHADPRTPGTRAPTALRPERCARCGRGETAWARVGRARRRGWRGKRSLVLTSADAPGTRRLAVATSVRPCGPGRCDECAKLRDPKEKPRRARALRGSCRVRNLSLRRYRLRGRCNDIGELVLLRPLGAELDVAVDQREQRVVLADADVHARMDRGAALADDDAAGANHFAAVDLDAETLRLGVAPVARTAACLFMCHECSSLPDDRVDLEFGVVLAMALVLLVMLAAAHLEDLHLFAATVRDDRCRHRRAGDGGLTQTDAFAFSDHQHLIENHICAHIRRYLFYFEFLTGGNLVLLAAGFYDRVHERLRFLV